MRRKFGLGNFLPFAHTVAHCNSVTDALLFPIPEGEGGTPVPAYNRPKVVSDLSILLQFRNCSYCGSFGAREALLTCADCGESYHRCIGWCYKRFCVQLCLIMQFNALAGVTTQFRCRVKSTRVVWGRPGGNGGANTALCAIFARNPPKKVRFDFRIDSARANSNPKYHHNPNPGFHVCYLPTSGTVLLVCCGCGCCVHAECMSPAIPAEVGSEIKIMKWMFLSKTFHT